MEESRGSLLLRISEKWQADSSLALDQVIIGAVFAVGLLARLFFLWPGALGMDPGQSVILIEGLEILEGNRNFTLFANHFTFFEQLPGLYFALMYQVTGSLLWGPLLITTVELILFYFLLKQLQQTHLHALWLCALIWASPWALFYSGVNGTCVGLGLWTIGLLLIFYKPRLWPLAIVFVMLGLCHYTAFRVLAVAFLLVALYHRQFRFAAGVVLGGLSYLLLVAWFHQWEQFWLRGSYLQEMRDYSLLASHLYAIAIWLLPPLEQLWPAVDAVYRFEISHVLNILVGFQPITGWGFSLAIIAWMYFGLKYKNLQWVYPCQREPILHLWVLSLLPIAWAASPSHFLFLLPFGMVIFSWGTGWHLRPGLRRGVGVVMLLGITYFLMQIPERRALLKYDFFSDRGKQALHEVQSRLPRPGGEITILSFMGFHAYKMHLRNLQLSGLVVYSSPAFSALGTLSLLKLQQPNGGLLLIDNYTKDLSQFLGSAWAQHQEQHLLLQRLVAERGLVKKKEILLKTPDYQMELWHIQRWP